VFILHSSFTSHNTVCSLIFGEYDDYYNIYIIRTKARRVFCFARRRYYLRDVIRWRLCIVTGRSAGARIEEVASESVVHTGTGLHSARALARTTAVQAVQACRTPNIIQIYRLVYYAARTFVGKRENVLHKFYALFLQLLFHQSNVVVLRLGTRFRVRLSSGTVLVARAL